MKTVLTRLLASVEIITENNGWYHVLIPFTSQSEKVMRHHPSLIFTNATVLVTPSHEKENPKQYSAYVKFV